MIAAVASTASSTANKLPTRITATTDRRQALEGASYVMSCVRVGGLEAYADDIRIPLKYGVDQCVGDTICAGGILYGQRNIPVILDFCKDIREVAEPGALFLNYANPMAMNTWAAIEYGKVDTVGLCHGVQHGGEQIAEVLGATDRASSTSSARASTTRPGTSTSASAGRKIGKDELIAAFERHPVYSQQEKVRIDVLKRFGFYSTEIERPPVRIPALVPQAAGGDRRAGSTCPTGSTARPAAISRYCTERRNWFETDFPSFLEEADKPLDPASAPPNMPATSSRRWRPAASIAAISTSRTTASSPTCRPTRSSRSPGFVDRFGINMAAGITLPEACAATCIVVDQRPAHGASHAAIDGDVDLLKLAVLHDPLVGAICTPEEVWQMVDEMVVAQAEWLPQYADAIHGAKERLARATVKTRDWAGAARQDAAAGLAGGTRRKRRRNAPAKGSRIKHSGLFAEQRETVPRARA